MNKAITSASKRTVIDTAGKKLHVIITSMMTHERAVSRLSGGLRLTWDREGSKAFFGMSRPSPSAPGAVEIETVRKQAPRDLDLSGQAAAWTERIESGDYAALWHGLRWELLVEDVKLNA